MNTGSGLKGKEPAQRVAGKRIVKPTPKINGTLDTIFEKKFLGIKPVRHAMHELLDEPMDDKGQRNIDNFIEAVPKWTPEGLLEHIVQFVVNNDQAFVVIEKDSFCSILRYQWPTMKELDIPKRTKLTEEIKFKADVAKRWLREHFKSELIGFAPIEGNHGGANIAATLMKVVDRYGFRKKLGWITGDNVSVNNKAASTTQRGAEGVDQKDRAWKARQWHGRCMEHTIHLGAKAFVEVLDPSFCENKISKVATVENAGDPDNEHEDTKEWTLDWDQLDAVFDNEEVDIPADFEPGDLLGSNVQGWAGPPGLGFIESGLTQVSSPALGPSGGRAKGLQGSGPGL
ncbi:hypothetical protein C0991_003240 [Blastosporella zonata]|nr:hypothetical protein C0991_003240 [Blastosporella zonata]